MSEFDSSGLGAMQCRIESLAEALESILGCCAVNLDDQEYADLVIFARARAVLELDNNQ